MFFTWDNIKEISRNIRRISFEGVSEELRGWNWSEPPVAPLHDIKLGVSDIVTGYCDSGRNIYLKYVKHAREKPNPILERGSIIHMIHEKAVATAKKIIYSLPDLSGEEFFDKFIGEKEKVSKAALSKVKVFEKERVLWIVEKLWMKAALTYSAQLENSISRSRHLSRETIVSLTVPENAEFAIDGTLVGLTPTLRIDSLLPPGILVEIKTRPYKPEYELALAGYALAFESLYEVPVDHGVLLQVVLNEELRTVRFYQKIIAITDDLRTTFIERRDRLAGLVAMSEDPGMPSLCSPACPYLHVCKPAIERIARRP